MGTQGGARRRRGRARAMPDGRCGWQTGLEGRSVAIATALAMPRLRSAGASAGSGGDHTSWAVHRTPIWRTSLAPVSDSPRAAGGAAAAQGPIRIMPKPPAGAPALAAGHGGGRAAREAAAANLNQRRLWLLLAESEAEAVTARTGRLAQRDACAPRCRARSDLAVRCRTARTSASNCRIASPSAACAGAQARVECAHSGTAGGNPMGANR